MGIDGLGPVASAWVEARFGAPSRCQALAWPVLARGEHALITAPTGSGKTLAAFLSALDRLATLPDDAPRGTRVLYVSPLKALAADIERNLHAPLHGLAQHAAAESARHRAITVAVRTGDTPARERAHQRKHPPDVLVTTPESLYLLLGSGAADGLRTVETVIVDEVHALLPTKRGVHLALSLERLAALTARDPQRIGLSATVRPMSIATAWLAGDRPLTLVDASEPPRLDLRVEVPGGTFEPPPPDPERRGPLQYGPWPHIVPRVIALIRAHRTTLVFTESRVTCERLVAVLNAAAGEPLVRAHHGSLSATTRREVEDALSAGTLRGLVTTSSLELGVDMASVDLVVCIGSPGSVSRGLQRVGRARHRVGETSQGVLIARHRVELAELILLADRMRRADLEPIRAPLRCLDVLAQQVVATVARAPTTAAALFAQVRRAHPYRSLDRAAFDAVLGLAIAAHAGADGTLPFRGLRATLVWDRTTDRLTARPGTRLLAVTHGGTIPDRGLYPVFLASGGPRLGELDEEMVHESRVGDVIVLGATSWRVDGIAPDRVTVSPAPGLPGRLPFWRGERVGRPYDVGRSLGALWRRVEAALTRGDASAQLRAELPVDDDAARNLVALVADQARHTTRVPSDTTVVVERFRDPLGDWRVLLLTPFGARVNAAWALALAAGLSSQRGTQVRTHWTDDGVALRFPDSDVAPDLEALVPDPDDTLDLVLGELRHAPLFAARFRENAARALLLRRPSAQGRAPLWLQRRRAAELLAICQEWADFPITLETVRECVEDVLDVPALLDVLRQIRARAIEVHRVDTESPSPLARTLLFTVVGTDLYAADAPLAERRAAALALDRALLRSLLGDVTPEVPAASIDAELAARGRLDPSRRARTAEQLVDLLHALGELTADELAARTEGDAWSWLAELVAAGRVVALTLPVGRAYVRAEDAAVYRDGIGALLPDTLPDALRGRTHDALGALVRRHARAHGGLDPAALCGRWGIPVGALDAALAPRIAEGELVPDPRTPGAWLHAEAARGARRRAMRAARDAVAPVSAQRFARFLFSWHGLDRPAAGMDGLRAAVRQLEGAPLPWPDLERRILPARVRDYQPALLDLLGATGELAWIGHGGDDDAPVVSLVRREHLAAFAPMDRSVPETTACERVLGVLQARGACFVVELASALTDVPAAAVDDALRQLMRAGWVTCDTFAPLRAARGRRGPARVLGGRFSIVPTPTADRTGRGAAALVRAQALLDRHGVVSREVAEHERTPGGFSAILPALGASEDVGRTRRGAFVEGLHGATFASAGAVDRVREAPVAAACVLAATDPANPWGGVLPWPRRDGTTLRPRRESGARVVLVDGAPVLWVSASARSAVAGDVDDAAAWRTAVELLRADAGYRAIRLSKVDHPDTLRRLREAGAMPDGDGVLIGKS